MSDPSTDITTFVTIAQAELDALRAPRNAVYYVEQLYDELAALREERDATQKRCDDAYRNVSALFAEFVNISLLTRLQGEVDDYAEVTKAVAELVAERDGIDADRIQFFAERDAARAWAKAWKRAARVGRHSARHADDHRCMAEEQRNTLREALMAYDDYFRNTAVDTTSESAARWHQFLALKNSALGGEAPFQESFQDAVLLDPTMTPEQKARWLGSEACVWTEFDHWVSGCGRTYSDEDGEAPSDHGIKFCPWCGKPILEVSSTAELKQ